jgi:hypothetical protein
MSELDDKTRAEAEAAQRLLDERRRRAAITNANDLRVSADELAQVANTKAKRTA